MVDEAVDLSLKELAKRGLKERRVRLPQTQDGYLRGSSLAGLCPREEVLAALLNVTREEKIDPGLLLTFHHGHGLHWALQNQTLPTLNVLYGRWMCLECGARYGYPRESSPLLVEDGVIPTVLEGVICRRPERCACGSPDFIYREMHYLAREYGTGGHLDGFLKLDGLPGFGVLEAKSTAKPWEVKHTPYLSHAIQAQAYMWFSGCLWAKVLYWNKGGDGLDSLIEHTLMRDDETIEALKVTLRSIWDGIRGGPLPAPVCATAQAPRACKCSVVQPCFERLEAERVEREQQCALDAQPLPELDPQVIAQAEQDAGDLF
jgi:hypothetical protein